MKKKATGKLKKKEKNLEKGKPPLPFCVVRAITLHMQTYCTHL